MKTLRRLAFDLLLCLAPLAAGAADIKISFGAGNDPAYPAALGKALRAAVEAERGPDVAGKAVPGPVPGAAVEVKQPPGPGPTGTADIRGSQAAGAFGGAEEEVGPPQDFLHDRPIVPFAAESGGVVRRYQIVAATHFTSYWNVLVLAEIASK
jgi:hypothetical protein